MVCTIATADLIILDVIGDAEKHPHLMDLVRSQKLKSGGKCRIDENQRILFQKAFDRCGDDIQLIPGGSASNTLRTLCLALPKYVKGVFVGTIGNEHYADLIRAEFKKANVELRTTSPITLSPTTAVSYVIKYHDEVEKTRTIATYPGNSRQLVVPEMFPQELFEDSDEFFLQGSIRGKFEAEVPNHILKQRWELRKKLWLAFPTSGFEPSYYQWLTPSANLVASNETELQAIFPTSKTVEEALEQLQRQQQSSGYVLEEKGWEPQVAMITNGTKGAYVVTAKEITPTPLFDSGSRPVINTLGAGDTCSAGFRLGKLLGMSNEMCLKLAVALARAKVVLHNGPTLPDPISALCEIAPALGAEVKRRIEKIVGAERAL